MASISHSHQFHISQQLLDNIMGLPLWVRQVVFLELQRELTLHFTSESLKNLAPEDTIAFYIPKITSEGERALLEQKEDLGRLLMDTKQQFTVLDICLKNQWNLETTSRYIVDSIKAQWVYPPSSMKALGTLEYLANRIRLGEYLVKMDRITMDQLEQALRTQQYIKEALQEHTGLANILINLGYITRQDTEGILFLKEESRKPVDNIALIDKLR